jgi:DMSO/TMAO reductase YedYZ molybdopterin-dependent catalytic subunit
MSPPHPAPISPVTIGRRAWIEWLGGATVLSLTSRWLGCGTPSATTAPSDAGAAGSGAGDGGLGCDTEVPFAPGPGAAPVFEGWGERTVDPQSLADILAGWTLTVDGLCAQPRAFGFQDLLCLPRQDQVTDFHCVEGWSIYDVPWNGVALGALLELVKPTANASYVVFHSVGGRYAESLPRAVASEPRTLMAFGVAGSSLPLSHGFPLRVVIPRLLGYKNAKYVRRIELADHQVPGYWDQYGYPYAGEVPPGRLRPGKY